MTVIKVGDDYADGDFSLLSRHLDLLDFELARINAAIKESSDSESDGLCDTGEYFIGHGFVAIQRYLTSTYAGLRIAQSVAFSVPPIVNSNLTFAEAIKMCIRDRVWIDPPSTWDRLCTACRSLRRP